MNLGFTQSEHRKHCRILSIRIFLHVHVWCCAGNRWRVIQDAGRQEQGYGQEDGAAPNRVAAVETGVANFYTDS